MIDPATNKPIRVSDIDKNYLDISVSDQHLDKVVALLEAKGVKFWVAHQRLSINGGPYMATINLRRGTDAAHVQTILDAAA